MTRTPPTQRAAERLIGAACRRLPADERAERYQEWSAELPAILADESIRLPFLRSARLLRYSAGVSRTTRYLRRTGGSTRRAATSDGRAAASPSRPVNPALRLVLGVMIWLVFVVAAVSLRRAFRQPDDLPIVVLLAMAAAFDACCLVHIARASQVRYLPKWAWALICLVQTPSGGIAYLCVGRVGRAPSAPPSSAT